MSYNENDLKKMREEMAKRKKGGFRDPNEFVPPKAKPNQEINYRFYVLPPLKEGDKTSDGVASRTMEIFYVENGEHWVAKKPIGSCPRVHNGEECDLCNYGFELMAEVQGDGKEAKTAKSAIARNFLPPQKNAINIYFPNDAVNPEELRGRVMWLNASKTIIDKFEECLMRDDQGDELNPEAFGIFFDENNAYLFQFIIKEFGGYNDYKSSKFLPNVRRPIAGKKAADGSIVALPDKIAEILALRHDLYPKFGVADNAKMTAVVKDIVAKKESGSDNGGFDVVSTPTTPGKVVSEDLDGEGGTASPKVTPKANVATKTTTVAPKATVAVAKTTAGPKVAPKTATPKATPAPVEAPIEEASEVEPAAADNEDAELAALMSELNEDAAV